MVRPCIANAVREYNQARPRLEHDGILIVGAAVVFAENRLFPYDIKQQISISLGPSWPLARAELEAAGILRLDAEHHHLAAK
jgi:hypothetical protein